MTKNRFCLLLIILITACHSDKGSNKRWCDRLPRPEYKDLQRVTVSDDWFEVYLVAEDVYAIYEPFQWQEVISYLILGNDKALLFDTGNGIGNLKSVVEELTTLPVVVLNSHTHFDHIGANADFDEILAMDTGYTQGQMLGMDNEQMKNEVSEEALCRPLPPHVSFENHHIRAFTVTEWIGDGHQIDLGDRVLEVISIPGHTPDAIALLDKESGLLWTGDSFYAGPIWLFVEETDLNAYKKTTEKLAAMAPYVRKLLPAHNTPFVEADVLVALQDAFAKVYSGEVEGELRSEGRVEYVFNGFSFLMNQPANK